MRKISLGAAAPLLIVGALLAGCGSSSKSTSTAGGAAASTPATTAAANSAPGPYGSSSSKTASTPAAAPAAAPVVISTKQSKVGVVLAGRKSLTVYLFEADKPGSSACSGPCAQLWPPVTGTAAIAGKVVAADLGTITRSDGAKQVTYKGHPLYYYAKDGDQSDAYGQGIKSYGASWYVLAPNGNKIDKS